MSMGLFGILFAAKVKEPQIYEWAMLDRILDILGEHGTIPHFRGKRDEHAECKFEP